MRRFAAKMIILGALAAGAGPAAAQLPITYQGGLRGSGLPSAGPHDFLFRLYDSALGGVQAGGEVAVEDLQVAEGVFTAQLDFGPGAFDGSGRWLEIEVRDGASSGAYALLSPRQPLTAAPYAIYAFGGPSQSWSMSGSSLYYDAGNVGIGKTDPLYRLDVAGAISASNAAGNSSFAISPASDDIRFNIFGPSGDGTILIARETPRELRIISNVSINRSFSQTLDHPLTAGTAGLGSGNGAHVTSGGIWTNGSSRTFKEGFEEIDRMEILERVAELPVTRWRYKSEDPGVLHIGPTAEDFHEQFGLGGDASYIGTVDADGVSLAAIQALRLLVKEKELEIARLREEKDRQINDLSERLERIEATLGR